MNKNCSIQNKYNFSKEIRKAYEMLKQPLGIYQRVDGGIITLLVSEGMCYLMKTSRNQLVQELDNNIFQNVHPDDVKILINLEGKLINNGGKYDFIIRMKNYENENYYNIHVSGQYQEMENGEYLMFLYYTNVSASEKKYNEIIMDYYNPQEKYVNHILDPMVVVTRQEKRILYYNQAVYNFMNEKIQLNSDSTFNEFFYEEFKDNINNIFNRVDMGPHIITEFDTGKNLNVNVVSSVWGQDLVYIIYFYEYQSKKNIVNIDNELRRKRNKFNHLIFSGVSNDKILYESNYQGYRVWNLSKNVLVLSEVKEELLGISNSNFHFENYIDLLISKTESIKEREELQLLKLDHVIKLSEFGQYASRFKIQLDTEVGKLVLQLDISMMQSQDTQEIFIKVQEENITDEMIKDNLIIKSVEEAYEYVVYMDFDANKYQVIYGKNNGKIESRYIYLNGRIATELNLFFENFGMSFLTIEKMKLFFKEYCRHKRGYSKNVDTKDGRIKNHYVQKLDRKSNIYYLRCMDVTNLLKLERKKEKELLIAQNDVLKANQYLEEAIQEERDKVEKVLVQIVMSISNIMDARDEYTSQHSERVAQYATQIALELNWELDRVQNLYSVALVHDIGKVGIPDSILLKNGKLTNEEYEIIKRHVEIGSHILKDFTAIDKVSEGAKYHHERYDGKGYMGELGGVDIPIEARIIGIADAIDAMNSTRPYREQQTIEYIKKELERESGKQFDPDLVSISLKLIDQGMLTLVKV